MINEGQYLVPRMTREERHHAISGPILVGGAKISPQLLTRLLNDVGDNPDQLPILQHSLMRTWSHWIRGSSIKEPIGLKEYQAIGTMDEALSMHAEEAYNELITERSKKICQALFKTITEKGVERTGTRRPTKLGEICIVADANIEEVKTVIDVFRHESRSFLMPPMHIPLDEESIIDISHESLMRIWKQLIKWVDEETQSADIYKRLAEAAAFYQDAKSGLWRNPELQFALKWYEETKPNSVWAQRYDPSFERAIGFLKASEKQEQFEILQKVKQDKQKIKRMQFFSIFLGTAAFISILLFIFGLSKKIEAEEETKKATASELEAKKSEGKARESQLEAEKNKKSADLEKENALVSLLSANFARNVAETHRQEAEKSKIEAELQREKANEALLDAQIQRNNANLAKDEAFAEKEKAIDSDKKTMRLRMLEMGRNLSFQAIRQFRENKLELSALLALQSYNFNRDNAGEELNPDIYNALSTVSGEIIPFTDHTDGIRSIAISKDGKKIISGSNDKTVRVWDINNPKGNPNVLIGSTASIRSVACSANDRYIAAGDINGNLIIWDMANKNLPPFILKGHQGSINSIAFDKNNLYLYSSGNDAVINRWKIGQYSQPPLVIDKTGTRIYSIDISPDGLNLASASEDGNVRIYDLNQIALGANTLQGFNFGAKTVTFSNNSQYLILVWNLTIKGSSPAKLVGHNSTVNDIAFGSDDKLLASASSDMSIHLWDYKLPHTESIVLKGHSSWVWALAFSPDGSTLVSGSEDHTLRTWQPNIKNLAETICDKVKRNLTNEEWEKFIGDINYEKTCTNY
jgi:WD40 repeat protein